MPTLACSQADTVDRAKIRKDFAEAVNMSAAEEDCAHMRKVVGFIRRHRAQRPDNVATSRWRYSLVNWGHDPLKD